MFEFENPYYFILLLLIPIGLVAQNKYVKWQTEKQAEFGTEKAIQKLLVNASNQKQRLKFTLQLMAVFFIVLALVNPKLGSKVETVNAKGVEIVFAIDVSKSMLCKDVAPDRLEKTKQIITQIINSIGSDRIGIVAYAGSAYPVLPMTTDYELAKMFTQSVNTDLISSQGTAIESAVQTSVDFFDNPTSGKAIILFSDGEDHENANFDVSKLTKGKNVKIITVGIGTTNGGNIEYLDEFGFQQVKKDQNGQVVITKLNDEVLQKIASESKGTYVYENQISKAVSNIKSALSNVEQQEFKAQQLAQKQSQFQWFLGIAFLLLLIDFFMVNQDFKGFHAKKWLTSKKFNLVLVFIFVSGTTFAQEKTMNSQQKEKQLRIVKSKEKAQKEKAEYNLGNTIYKNKKYSEAITNYKNASELAKTDIEKHKAFHNLGNAYMQDKNYKSAVESYKKALKANSKDEQTRYNLALAKKLLEKNPPKPKPKNKNKDKKDDKEKGKNKEDKEKKGEGENKKDKEKKGDKEKRDGENKKKPNANKQRMDNVLKAIGNDEKKVQEKINANKTKTNTKVSEKDW
ncbi:VWA domain-containing protein [Flavobacterium sp. F372]|uniref:VWA domain-containing protein n=1 Tax=Flavobacterium bernardetii TaxID=2813823 RepID=A0ABR7IYI4_9FLAO|nr:VWA domain-containing protein [Flavobacterium bernardetii]MBC5834802.1 VWA domain-containing protein [Flavobacterium bernardetii]NHF70645.1 VWA domain-containing protein [Flavobacterium bernardetii]